MKRNRPPSWPPRHANLPELDVLERLSLEIIPPAEPKELPAYRPCSWELDAGDPPVYPVTSDTETVATCLWSPCREHAR